jgi:DNA-binding XRE family transcriptional regulator
MLCVDNLCSDEMKCCCNCWYFLEKLRGQGYTVVVSRAGEMSNCAIVREAGVTQQKPRMTLQQMRLKLAMSATEVARAASVSTSTITDIEAGVQPRMRTIRRLAEALGCAPQDIAWPGDPFGPLELE